MDLTEAILILASSGVDSIREFPWFEAPDPQGLEEAIHRLRTMGALDEEENLTSLGKQISHLPVAPRFGRVLHEAARFGCLDHFALVTALSQSRPLFPARRKQGDHLMPEDFVQDGDFSDFQALIRAWSQMKQNRFRREIGERLGIHTGACRDVDRVAGQISRIASRWHSAPNRDPQPTHETFARVLLSGFSDRVGLRNNASTLACAVVGGRKGRLDRDSIAAGKESKLFVAGEMIEIEGRELEVKLSLSTRIEEAWLEDLFPESFTTREGAVYEERFRKVEARREKQFRDLVLESRPSGEIPLDHAAELLAGKVLEGELKLKAWDDSVEAWIARVNLVAQHFPDYGFPAIDSDSKRLLLEQICEGATSYKQVKDRKVWPVLREWLPAHLGAALDHLAPERIRLSTGREVRVIYRESEKPRISVLIQHLFGLEDQPAVCEGKVPVVFEILAPNHRPVQVTENLAEFWTGSYPAVRAQLRGRYPRHEWPEFE